MSWSDAGDIYSRLTAALTQYQWTAAAAVCQGLIRRVHEERTPFPEMAAREVLAALRKKRQFALTARVAEAFIRSGQNAPRVRRQYAQALIDQGILLAPEAVLQALTLDPLEGDSEVAEAHGLLGRLYKQLYVNADTPTNSYARTFFERALSEYLQTYRLNPASHSWHGINAVALLHRGKEDGIDVTLAPDADMLAQAVLASLPASSKAKDAFDIATRLEALIALGRTKEAERTALDYVAHPGADAFEIASTLRQLEEVWRLTSDSPPGSTILPLLRAAQLQHEGGALQTGPRQVEPEIDRVRQAAKTLEKKFGEDAPVTLQWYEKGLRQTRSVARIDRLSGKGHGTGWLVRSEDFFPKNLFPDGPRLLLLTNAHVVNADGTDGALAPDDARANFQVLEQVFDFEPRVVWSSPPDQLDATFLAFRGKQPKAEALTIYKKKVRFTEPAARMYIIGHPGGNDLRLSLNDNVLLGCDAQFLHYRTPTEGGSSGSPVFEAEDWRVAGLHHAGGTLERLDGKQPPYEANEGIGVLAIKEGIAAAPASWP